MLYYTFRVRDLVHGTVLFTSTEQKIINHPFFQRLRDIRQNDVAFYVYPSLNTSRFEHALGVCHIAGKMAENLTRSPKWKLYSKELRKETEISSKEEFVEFCRLYALLHDIGHFPLSHLFEFALYYYAVSVNKMLEFENITEKKETSLIPQEKIENRIFLIRGKKVMLDRDLADLYEVETRRLNEQVRRNIKRFPEDFMFQLNQQEFKNLISQNATSSWGGARKLPLVFTEPGVAMLSSVLNSERAVQVNIQIIRTFIKLREMILTHKDLKKKIEDLERKYEKHDSQFKVVFNAIKHLLEEKIKPKNKVGFIK